MHIRAWPICVWLWARLAGLTDAHRMQVAQDVLDDAHPFCAFCFAREPETGRYIFTVAPGQQCYFSLCRSFCARFRRKDDVVCLVLLFLLLLVHFQDGPLEDQVTTLPSSSGTHKAPAFSPLVQRGCERPELLRCSFAGTFWVFVGPKVSLLFVREGYRVFARDGLLSVGC